MCSLGALLALGSLVVVLPDVAYEETLAFLDSCSVSTRSLHWAMTAVAGARAAAAITAARRLTCQQLGCRGARGDNGNQAGAASRAL